MNKTPFDNLVYEFEQTPEYISLDIRHKYFGICIFRQMLYTKQTKYTYEDLLTEVLKNLYLIITVGKAARYGPIIIAEWDKEKEEWFIMDVKGDKQYESSFKTNENKCNTYLN